MTKIKTSSVLVLLLLSLFSASQVGSKKVCRALALSGGANKGSYEVGVIYGLTHLLKDEDVQYDVVSGVSAGAINAAAVSLFEIG
jgi:predicted acylesterase/phospholipase RssA